MRKMKLERHSILGRARKLYSVISKRMNAILDEKIQFHKKNLFTEYQYQMAVVAIVDQQCAM